MRMTSGSYRIAAVIRTSFAIVTLTWCEYAISQDHPAKSESKPLLAVEKALSGVTHGSLPSPTIPEGLGVNIHFTDPRLGELDALAAAGFRWVRMDFSWSGTEEKRGVYNFAAYERLLAALDAHKIRAVFILDYSNKLYEGDKAVTTDAGRTAFGNWAAAATKHFKGRGILWEIWNEPNIKQFWQPQPDAEQYAALAISAAKAIREVTPSEAIIGPASSTIDLKFLEGCFKAGLLQWWNAVSVHPYRQSGPETVEGEYHRLRRLIAKYAPRGKKVPILSGEWGYSAAWKNFDADQQGKMLPRQFLTNLAHDIPLSIWYDWHDDGTEVNDPEHHFGTVAFTFHPGREMPYDPKPAYIAAKTLTSTLDGFQLTKRIAVGRPDDYAMLMSKNNSLRLAVWTTAEPHEILIPSGPCTFDVVEHTGKHRSSIATKGTSIAVAATDAPLYLIAHEQNAVLANAPQTHPLRIALAQAGNAIIAHFENLADTEFKGKVHLIEATGIEPSVAELPLAFASDEIEKSLSFRLASRPKGVYRCGLQVHNEAGALIFNLPAQNYVAVADDILSSCKIEPDGDPKVGSKQELTPGHAPQPFLDPDASVVKLTYYFDDGWKFLRAVTQSPEQKKIAGEPKAIGMWVYGDGRRTSPRLRVTDSTGQTWQPSGAAIDWVGWRYVQFDLAPSTAHWGGAKDSVIHYPLTWDTVFLLDNASKKQNDGIVYLAAPVLIY